MAPRDKKINKWRETQMKTTPPSRFYVWSLRGLLGATAFGAIAFGLATTVSTQAQAADPIKIGVIAEAQAIAGASIPQAAQMAADEINAKGGVDGRKIEIVTHQNLPSSPTRGPSS